MRKLFPLSCAAALLLLSGCPSPLNEAATGNATPSRPADQVADVSRPFTGEFRFQTLLPVALNLSVDLYSASGSGRGALEKLAPGAAEVIANLHDSKGNLVYAGKVQADGTLHGGLSLPAAPEDMTLTLSAEGFGERQVVIRDMRRYSEVNRKMALVSTGSAARSASLPDRDGDGVPDAYDASPDDPQSAFTLNVPASGPLTVAFEDLYLQAQAGDADYNDFIAEYQITLITDSANKVVRVEGHARATVKLAGYNHRFGIFFSPFAGDALLNVTYLNASGLSAGRGIKDRSVSGQADIVLFDSTKDSVGKTADFSLEFKTPQDPAQIDQAPYNPYLYVYNTGYDIHLMGEGALPNSRNSGSSFQDSQGFPWALLVPSAWKNPDEGQRIEIPYPRFTLWRQSMGAEFTDWYLHYYDPYVPPVQVALQRAADINPGAGSSNPSSPCVFGTALYFSATDGSSGTELWKYDGTSAARAADINAGSGSSNPSNLCVFSGALYFSASDGSSGTELWKYNGTSPSLVDDINTTGSSNPTFLTVFNSKLYFQATTNGIDFPLFAYDGSLTPPAAVTTLVTPAYLQTFGTALYMAAGDSAGTAGRELYSTNGTTITLVKDINPAGNSNPANLTVFNSLLCFSAYDGTNTRLWKSNGTGVGTVLADASKSVTPVPGAAMVVFANALYFLGNDGSTGVELWKYDGSSISQVKDLNPGSADGVAATGMGVYGGALYFSGNDGGGAGWELYKYDGSTVSLVKDINPGAGDSNPGQFMAFNGKLYFQADDGSSDSELWVLSN